jgi:hypothetical protein
MRRVRRVPMGLAVIVGVAVLVGPLAGAAWAPNGHNWKSRTPFTAQFFDSSTNETVSLGGTIVVKIKVGGNETTGLTYALHAAVHQTTGTGATTGGAYKLTGHDSATVQISPGPPTGPVLFHPTYTLHPPSPCRAHHPPGPCFNPTTLAVPVSAFLATNGEVTGVDAGQSTT